MYGSRRIWWISGLVLILVIGGGLAAYLRSSARDPIPPEIAADQVLLRGREIYGLNCVACHGPTGRADGPLAKTLTPRPRNLASDPWKYGDQPEQVLKIIAEGAKEAQMPGWGGTYSPLDLKATAAYLYQVTGKPVPESLRSSPAR